ncbi:MAG TPA: hypothetical protein VHW26_11730, partial [Solirubrobacteraceae bacterium]|nr:hypothetical protein [Solirubrobacteraceae bacterium]
MTLFPPDVLEAAGIGTKPALRVSTKYMETFLPVRPVSSGTELHPFENGSGVIDLYSVGTDARVRRLRRGQAAAAPYEETRLGITATQLYVFVPADGGADTPSVFGLDGKGALTLSTAQPDGSYLQQPCQPARATQAIRRFLGVRGSTGRVYVNARLDDGRLATNSYDPIGQKWAGEVWVPVHGPDGTDAIVKDIAVAANNPVQSALFAIDSDDEVLFAEDSFRTSTLRKLGRKASRLAVVTDARNLLCVFAVDAMTGLLWVKRQRAHSTQGIQFDDWVRVDDSQDRRLVDVRANLRLDNAVEVFAFDEAGSLRHSHELADAKGKPVGWQVLFPIGEQPAGSIFATTRNSSGYAEAYTVTSDSEAYRFWQSPESEQWFSEHLEIAQSADELISVPTHATEVVVVDDTGQPVGDADVVVNASFLSTLWVNGLAYRASMVDPVKLRTPANGKLVLHQRANALAGATLLIATPQTQAGAPLVVEPNSQLQEKLAGMNAAAILDAKDSARQPLLPIGIKDREKIAESIAQITKRSMDIAQAVQPGTR